MTQPVVSEVVERLRARASGFRSYPLTEVERHREVADEMDEAAALILSLEAERNEALKLVTKYAREAGEATGRLEMSEAAGIVDGWRERTEAAEARATRAETLLAGLEGASGAERAGEEPDGSFASDAQRKSTGAPGPWACFHCDFTAHTLEEAREHFGPDRWAVAACQAVTTHRERIERIINDPIASRKVMFLLEAMARSVPADPPALAQPEPLTVPEASANGDGLLWRALMRCGRIKMQGSSGVDRTTGERNGSNVHFGAEFWPEHLPADYREKHPDEAANYDRNTRWGVAALKALAEAIIERDAALPPTITDAPVSCDAGGGDALGWASLIAAEFAKPQFMTTTSGGGHYSVNFSFSGDGARERCEALEDAFRAAGRAINGPAQ